VCFRSRLACLLGVCASLLLGCSAGVVEQAPTIGSGAQDLEGGACQAVSKTVTGLTQTHLAECSAIDYPDNPPAGGDHYPIWAAFRSYAFPIPRGYWVHDLEHGAVVFSYHCDDGCADEVAEVQALIDGLPADPLCSLDTPRRVVLTPDPLLATRWGLSAWGHTLSAVCVDTIRFRQFYLNHFGLGPERLCNAGEDFGSVQPCQ
jgi:hypothetical protein